MTNQTDTWVESPITGKQQVLVEYDEQNEESKFDLSSGFFTNSYPLNYTKYPNFDINQFENGMPELIRALRFDDGSSYWYPTTIQSEHSYLFPVGTLDEWSWCWAPVVKLTDEESAELSTENDKYESKLDMENCTYHKRFLDAAKKVNGFSLNMYPEDFYSEELEDTDE